MARVWVTGHRGYLGECVASCLAERGWCVVTTDGRLQDQPAASVNVDAVIHCAGVLRSRGESSQHPGHVDGTHGMLRALNVQAPVVYVSSRSVYGVHDSECIPVCAACRPGDAYGRAKLMAEQSIVRSGLAFTHLRLSVLVGAGVSRDGEAFLKAALHKALDGGSVSRFCPDRAHDALDVWTAARACVAALEAGPVGKIYNLAGPARGMHATLAALTAVAARGALHDSWRSAPPFPVLDRSNWTQDFGEIEQPDDETIFESWVQWLAAGSGRPDLPKGGHFVPIGA